MKNSNTPQPSSNIEPTCQGMFDSDDYIIPYLKFHRSNPKYKILYNNILHDAYILSNLHVGRKLYDTRNVEEIKEDEISCEIFVKKNDLLFLNVIKCNKNDFILIK